MSKRLFILSSLLETHPRRATTETRVWTLVVVEAEIGRQGGGAPSRAAIRHALRPLAQQRLNEPLGFAVGLGAVWTRETMTHHPPLTDRGEHAGVIGHRVIGEQAAHANAAPTKPAERPLQKGGTRRGVRSREHFRVGQPRRVIDRDMQIFPADMASTTTAIAMDPMPDLRDAAEPLQIDVQQIAD